ncbi:RecA-superfamily ATPases implicated in signal transduction (plasmid) [Euzebya pacifica]|uniref:RecA-superfamily ATPases implicated in signal transduction n=1 Tax=Euzebya pacifica TaxID=1608957 RepID=A0A346Y6A1_9ACTN|nr:ATP-binding protein [Euzebya pacifica]AXV09998.1 RecA-superfamily ATPases implicated in signal transduction [Euzebya pacifica]
MPDPFKQAGNPVLSAADNPFRPGIGRVPPAFGGREGALGAAKVIIDVLAGGGDPDFLLIRGVRGVGKTALMAYARRHANDAGVVCVHLEADRGPADPAVTINRLISAADAIAGRRAVRRLIARVDGLKLGPSGIEVSLDDRRPATSTVEEIMTALAATAAAAGRGVLLTVDEVQEAEDALFRPLMRAVHYAAQEAHPVGLIAAGLPGATDALRAEGQTYTERLDTVELGMLGTAGVAEAIRAPFDNHGVTVDDTVVETVARDSGGYPFFVQLWGWALWLSATDRVRIGPESLPAARDRVSQRTDRFMLNRAKRIPTGRARHLVAALARAGGHASTADLLAATGFTSGQYSPVRQELLDSGLVFVPARGRLAFSVPGFADWIDRNGADQ